MDLWRSLSGMVEVELSCPDSAFALKKITGTGIVIHSAYEGKDGFGLRLSIARSDYRLLAKIAAMYGYECRVLRRKGIYWEVKSLLRRPVLIVGMTIFLFLSIYLPSRILFFEVEGNIQVPTKLILQECENAGIDFGCSREEIRSERVKNALLESIPQLKWVGVNTSGCVAVITVQERPEQPEKGEIGVSSIVASRDGIVTSCTASRGNLLVKPGQAVGAGDVLISGYTDCGLSIRATRSEGEIYAQTDREITTVLPSIQQTKGEILSQDKKYSVIIGKKRINFYKDSGILGDSCDKMYESYVLTLPGGFQLPVSFIVETRTYRESTEECMDPQAAAQMLQDYSLQYLQSSMVAGQVMKSSIQGNNTEQLFSLTTKYFCHEMIGQVRNEEIIKPNGK